MSEPEPRSKLFNMRVTLAELAELRALADRFTGGNLARLIRLAVKALKQLNGIV